MPPPDNRQRPATGNRALRSEVGTASISVEVYGTVLLDLRNVPERDVRQRLWKVQSAPAGSKVVVIVGARRAIPAAVDVLRQPTPRYVAWDHPGYGGNLSPGRFLNDGPPLVQQHPFEFQGEPDAVASWVSAVRGETPDPGCGRW